MSALLFGKCLINKMHRLSSFKASFVGAGEHLKGSFSQSLKIAGQDGTEAHESCKIGYTSILQSAHKIL